MDSLFDINDLPIVQARLDFLVKKLYTNLSTGTYKTQEDVNKAVANIVKIMSRGADKPIYDLPRIVAGTPPERNKINKILIKVYNELNALSDVLYKTGSSVEANFNFAVSKIRKLQAGIKKCNQQLSVYSLYLSDDANSFQIGETFSSETNIDKGSKFLSEAECFVNLEEGTVSLPLEGEKQIWPIKKVELGARSNCVLGNNVQAQTPVRGKINSLHDGNLDSWTEFERVVSSEDKEHITVELKITLEDKQVVNGFRIVPVLLGAGTTPRIKSIQFSEDGRSWSFIDEDVSVAEFLDETREDKYHFSPHAGKFSGEFNLTFPPKLVKFVQIILHQSSTFGIKDTSDNYFLRYAIGIKEVEIYGVKYQDVGELISSKLDLPGSMRAVALRSVYDPVGLPPETGNLEYSVSFDDGTSWQRISRQKDSLLNIPEVIFPPENQTSLRYKVKLIKNEEAYAAYKKQTAEDVITQTVNWGDQIPLEISLLKKPVSDTLTICDPEIATIGNRYPKVPFARGTTSNYDATNGVRTGASILTRRIPLLSNVDARDINIEVDGSSWDKVAGFDGSNWYDRHYKLSKAEDGSLEVVFGNGNATSPKGLIPSPDQEISLYLEDQQVSIENIGPPYFATLEYPSNGVKNDTVIYLDGEISFFKSQQLPKGVKKVQLEHYPVDMENSSFLIYRWSSNFDDFLEAFTRDENGTIYTDVKLGITPIFNNYKDFVDGYTELGVIGDWSIDDKNGVIYFYEPTSLTDEMTVTYFNVDRVFLRDEDWDFVEGSLDKIQIYERGYDNIKREISGSEGDYSAILPALNDGDEEAYGIVLKSVKIKPTTSGTDVFGTGSKPFEVPFINGTDEFAQKGTVRDEEVLVLTGAGGIQSFTLKQGSNFFSGSSPWFSNQNTFLTQKDALVDVVIDGDWYIDQLTGEVSVYLDVGSNTEDTTVSYLYEDPDAESRAIGAYSVNLKKGIVHFANPAEENFEIEFKQAPYKIRYTMSRQLEEGKDKDYTLNLENKTITITTPSLGNKGKVISIQYKYVPDEEDLFNLADHFSPLLRGLAIKAALM